MRDARYLYDQAERCFRLARGSAGLRLADELESLGHAFEREAREIEGIGTVSANCGNLVNRAWH